MAETPENDRLLRAGFRTEFSVERLELPLDDGNGNVFVSKAKLLAYPVRGEARRLFGRKPGPAGAEVHSNIPLEKFGAEKDEGRTELRDTYREKCAVSLYEMLCREEPLLDARVAA